MLKTAGVIQPRALVMVTIFATGMKMPGADGVRKRAAGITGISHPVQRT
jgi:hypothetical protein